MEKKSKLKIDYFVIAAFVLSFLGILVLEYLLKASQSFLSIFSFSYWLFFVFWTYVILRHRSKSTLSFVLSFLLFFISSALVIFDLAAFGEVLMRYSFIFLFFGVSQSLVEFLNHKHRGNE